MIFRNLTCASKIRAGKDDLMQKLDKTDLEIVVTVGAGDIDTFVEPIKKMLMKKYEA
jgi:UDP-N-acetylmuramate--alanine ligase